jgi:hypothetical protein
MSTELEALAIPARYRLVLTDQMQLSTHRDLILADREAIRQAIQAARKKPPTLEEIAVWQDEARRHRPVPPDNPDPWDTSASFVVCFQQRPRPDQSWERRIEVEHTEVEPEQAPAEHDGWDCHWVCTWMRERLGLPASDSTSSSPPSSPADQTAVQTAAPPATAGGAAPSPLPTRQQVAFHTVTLTGPDGTHDLTRASDQVSTRQPAQLVVELSDPPPANARLAIQVRLLSRDSRNIYDQPLSDRVTTIDLRELADESQKMTIVAWTPGDTSDPAILRVPGVYVDTHN